MNNNQEELNNARKESTLPLYGVLFKPMLEEMHNALWEFEAMYEGLDHEFDADCMNYATKIFFSVLLSNMWRMQENENMPQKEREKMAQYYGDKVYKMVKEATNIDTKEFYE